MSLIEVDQILRLNKVPLTREESEVLNSWRNKATRQLGIGIGVGSIASWLVTRRINRFARANLAAVVGISYGLWRCNKSLESTIEQCLSLQGTRLQRELAGIIVRKYQNDFPAMKHISKYFISENVYDDSATDKPKQMWRLRNFFGENLESFQRTEDDSFDNATHSEGNNVQKTNTREDYAVSRRKANQKSHLDKQVSSDDDATSDLFDSIFGHPDNVDEISHQSSTSSDTPPRKHGRSHRRAHRRRQSMHRQETSEANS